MARYDPADVHIDWHRHDADEQIIVSVDADGVKIAIAFPADLARADFESVLAELDREFDHFWGPSARDPSGHVSG